MFGAEFFDFGVAIINYGLMPDTYFILASKSEIAQLKTIDDVMKQMEKIEPLLGGECFSLEAITNLSEIFLKEKAVPIATNIIWKDGSRFYVLDKELCGKVALIEWDDLLQASVPWSESDVWKNVELNRMDLAGMIIDFASLCKQTNEKKSLYFLLSNED